MSEERNNQRRTTSAMHNTADQLEEAEAILHHSADSSPSAATKARLHRLGDQVTEVATDVARRADRISGEEDRSEPR